MWYECPKCGSDRLDVSVTVTARIKRFGYESGLIFQPEWLEAADFDDDDWATCFDCSYDEQLGAFKIANDKED